MQKKACVLASIVLAFSLPAFAQNQPQGVVVAEKAPGAGAITEAVQLQGKVKSIDKKALQVVVVGANGYEVVFSLGEEARNFDQIKVGDLVTLTYTQALALELKKSAGDGIKRVDSEQAVRTKPGEKPGVAVEKTVQVTASVVGINPKAQTITLRGPKRTVELYINDPAQLQNVKIGDYVDVTYVEATALMVTAEKKK